MEPVTVGIGGMTVASPFRERGFAAAVWGTSTASAHQVNEACSIRHMVADAQVLAHAFALGLRTG